MVTVSCTAMKTSNKNNIFKEITAVKNPRHVDYTTNDRVVIAGSDGAHIVNPGTNTIIKCLNKFDYFDKCKEHSNIKICKNKKRIISFYGDKIIGYNAESGKQEWWLPDQPYIRSFDCDAQGETVFVCYEYKGLAKYSYGTDNKQIVVSPLHNQAFYSISTHPTEKKFCVTEYMGNISYYSFDDSLATFKKEITVPQGYVIKYSPDGSCIAAHDYISGNIWIINTNMDEDECIEYDNKKNVVRKDLRAVAFHPNNVLLATLIRELVNPRKMLLCYWDIKNEQLVETIDLKVEDAWGLAFSDDGLHVIIAVKDKCLTGPVPFKIRWHNNNLYFMFLLKNSLNRYHEMPSEIVYYTMGNFVLV